jgi:hypothetical protein
MMFDEILAQVLNLGGCAVTTCWLLRTAVALAQRA